MADDNDVSMPTPPASPKKRVSEPFKPPSQYTRVAQPKNSEGFDARDLALQTRGPISNQRGVEKEITRDLERRNVVEGRHWRAIEKSRNRPYSLRGGKR